MPQAIDVALTLIPLLNTAAHKAFQVRRTAALQCLSTDDRAWGKSWTRCMSKPLPASAQGWTAVLTSLLQAT